MFEIADRDGQVMFELPFTEVIESMRGSRKRPPDDRRLARTRGLIRELTAQIDTARATIQRSAEILNRSKCT
jgi:hypothetical protein